MTETVEVLHWVQQFYERCRVAVLDAVERLGDHRDQSWVVGQQWIAHTWKYHSNRTILPRWAAIEFNPRSEQPRLVAILRFYSRRRALPPTLMMGVVEREARAPEAQDAYNLAVEIGYRAGEEKSKERCTQQALTGRLVALHGQGEKTPQCTHAFCVRLEDLVDTQALDDQVVRPLDALLDGDIGRAAALLADLPDAPLPLAGSDDLAERDKDDEEA